MIRAMHDELSCDWAALKADIQTWSRDLGFDALAVTDATLSFRVETGLQAWLDAGFHGQMAYMANHGQKRARPSELVPGTKRLLTVRMNYLAPDAHNSEQVLADNSRAFISRYALGRDYHKVLRNKLQKLAQRIETVAGKFGYRAFADSAPVMEVEAATQSGLGWRGKHTLLLTREHGSFFFLGELFVDLPLPVDAPLPQEHCGRCTKCIDICPTRAIVAPYQLDARRCVSYLTIELKGSIPEEFRTLIGNRVYGCDDCQLFCPWNRFAQSSGAEDFSVRHGLDNITLVDLFSWNEADFTSRMTGSAIYRIGYEQWLRNIAVGLGNAPSSGEVIRALESRRNDPSALVREHVEWALVRHANSPITIAPTPIQAE